MDNSDRENNDGVYAFKSSISNEVVTGPVRVGVAVNEDKINVLSF